MLAQKDSDIEKAVTLVHRFSQDEHFRQRYEAREDFIRQQIDHDYWFHNEIKKREATISEMGAALSEKDAALSKQQAALSEKDATLSKQQAALSEKDAIIAELKRQLAAKS